MHKEKNYTESAFFLRLESRRIRVFFYLCNMKILIRHIEALLLEHDCVIVQGLGGFIANPKTAQYHVEENVFLPPCRAISFNQQLRENDGLLIQSYMQTFDAAYPEALCQLEKDVSQLCLQLDMNGEIQMGSLGILKKDLSGRIILMDAEADTLSPENYGLAPLHLLSLNKLLNVQPKEDTSTVGDTKQKIQPANRIQQESADEDSLQSQKQAIVKHPFLMDLSIAAAIAAILFILFSAPMIHHTPKAEQDSCIAGPIIAKPNVIQKKNTDASARPPITRIDKQPSNKPEAAASAITSNTEQYTLVLACHVSEKNAQLFIQHLTKAGYNHAEFVKGKVPRILYGNYPTEQEAKDSLRQLRKDNADFASAWVMKIKTEGV